MATSHRRIASAGALAALTLSSLAACATSPARRAPVPVQFDHVMVAIDSIHRGIALLEGMTGVRPALGGVHPGRGTQNALLSLGPGRYLELLAPNPADAAGPRAVAEFAKYRTPTPVGWSARVTNADSLRALLVAAGERAGDPVPGSRRLPDGRTLGWRTLVPWPGPRQNALPFFIEWAPGAPHPASDAPGGCTLASMQLVARAPDSVRARLGNARIEASIVEGAADGVRLEMRCPRGAIVLPAPAP